MINKTEMIFRDNSQVWVDCTRSTVAGVGAHIGSVMTVINRRRKHNTTRIAYVWVERYRAAETGVYTVDIVHRAGSRTRLYFRTETDICFRREWIDPTGLMLPAHCQ